MKKAITLNVVMNTVFAAVFVFLNNQALRNGLAETFMSLALLYGITVIIGNVVCLITVCSGNPRGR